MPALKTLHVRITLRRGALSRSYTEQVDLDDEREMWEEWTTNGANPHLEGVTFEQYHSPLDISEKKVNDLNGRHFIFGFLESLYQSDRCPSFLFDNSDEGKVEVLWNASL